MDIALGKVLENSEIREVLCALMPGLSVAVRDTWEAVEPGLDVVLVRQPNDSEFPCGLSAGVKLEDGRDLEAWLRGLARALGERLATSAICDGSPYGDTTAPYWSVIWRDGEAYLGDDAETTLADGRGGPVRIVRRLALPLAGVPDAAALRAWVRPGSEAGQAGRASS